MSGDQSPTRIRVEGGTSWPHPTSLSNVGWRLRYGTPTDSDLLIAAEAISTLLHLYEVPMAARALPAIRGAMAKAAVERAVEGGA